MAVHYSITAGLWWSPIFSHYDWQVLTLWPCWYTEEIRKWKQIRKMPQDCIHPLKIKWHRTVPLQSHVNHIDLMHLSKASLQSQKHKLRFPAALQVRWSGLACLAWGLNGCVICLLKMFTYKWSYLLSRRQEACHILKICGAPSMAAQFWRQKRYLWGFHTDSSVQSTTKSDKILFEQKCKPLNCTWPHKHEMACVQNNSSWISNVKLPVLFLNCSPPFWYLHLPVWPYHGEAFGSTCCRKSWNYNSVWTC